MIDVDAVELRLLSLRLAADHSSASGATRARPVVVVRVVGADADGWGECVALGAPTYSAEYASGAFEMLAEYLAPRVLAASPLRPAGVSDALAEVRGHRMAKAALEAAILDAELRRAGCSLADHLGVQAESVPAGAVVGLAPSTDALVELVRARVGDGYNRVKIKIAPGADVTPLTALRDEFPDLVLQADANGAYRLDDLDVLRELDDLGLACLEQPLVPEDVVGHAVVADALRTPVCLDESLTSPGALRTAVALGACEVACVKQGPLGGPLAALATLEFCAGSGVAAWCGGMLETGLGRALNATLAAHRACTMVGDVGGGARFVEADPFGFPVLRAGRVGLHRGPGLAPAPDLQALRAVTARQLTVGGRS
jgi:o-succinylbenzoate synthase